MVRSCVGCRSTGAPSELVRVVLGPDGNVVPDLGGGAFGRGAWLHPRKDCVARAVPRGLSHALKAEVRTDAHTLVERIRAAAKRRTTALLQAARRSGKAALGTTAVAEAAAGGSLELCVVAADARAAAQAPAVEAAIARGRAVVFGSKAELGALFSREELGVIAILDSGLGEAILAAVRLSELELAPGRSPSLSVSEVR